MSVGLQGAGFGFPRNRVVGTKPPPSERFNVLNSDSEELDVVSPSGLSESENSTDNESSNSSSTDSPNSILSLGPTIPTLSRAESSDTETTATVTGGELTITGEDDQALDVQRGDELTFSAGENDEEGKTLTLENRSSGESFEVEAGTSLALSGEGQIRLFKDRGFTRVQSGEILQTEENDETLTINPTGDESLQLSEEGIKLDVNSTRPDQTDNLTIFSQRGRTITFEQGETGVIEPGKNGDVTIENTDRSRSVTVSEDTDLAILGEAEGILSSSQDGDRLEFSKGEDIQVSSADDNLSVTPSEEQNKIVLNTETEKSFTDDPISFVVRGDARTGTFRTLTENLLSGGESDPSNPRSPDSLQAAFSFSSDETVRSNRLNVFA